MKISAQPIPMITPASSVFHALSFEEMWKAVCEKDASYDGIFFYAVKSTGIYCRPSCRSKPPRRDMVCFFETASQAEAAGFRPCKRCRSDLHSYHPALDDAVEIKSVIERFFFSRPLLDTCLRQMGFSERRARKIFRDQYGITPLDYVKELRISEAKRLLSRPDKGIAEIAFSVGFGSLSAFYHFFREQTGMSPARFRREHGASPSSR